VDTVKATVLMIVEVLLKAILQALPAIMRDEARTIEPDERDDEMRERALRAFSEFEGVDLDTLNP